MNSKNLAMGLIVLAVIALAVFTLGSKPAQKTETPTPTAAEVQVDTTQPSGAVMEKGEYTDGTYEAIGNYTSPAQKEEVAISLTLKDGLVTDATFDGKAVNEISIKMQGKFSEGFSEEVVGKSLDEIALTVVHGSSLTPKGFMEAVEKIKVEAKQS